MITFKCDECNREIRVMNKGDRVITRYFGLQLHHDCLDQFRKAVYLNEDPPSREEIDLWDEELEERLKSVLK